MLILEMNGSQFCLERAHGPEWKTVTCPVNGALSQNTPEVSEAEVIHWSGRDGKTRGGRATGAGATRMKGTWRKGRDILG